MKAFGLNQPFPECFIKITVLLEALRQ